MDIPESLVPSSVNSLCNAPMPVSDICISEIIVTIPTPPEGCVTWDAWYIWSILVDFVIVDNPGYVILLNVSVISGNILPSIAK